MNLGLEGKVCVVTGATRGIGAATARMLAQEGARVLSVARRGADLELDVTAPRRRRAGARGLSRGALGAREQRGHQHARARSTS